MLYCMVLVPWSNMAPWIDWLDTMAPEWDFAYTNCSHIEKNEFSISLLFDYEMGMKNLDTCAHMRVCMTDEHMMLHKLTWDVRNIAETRGAVYG